jgi:glycosyltransferase involved in cell wall biosynthesis
LIGIVVPAHNEEASIGSTLASLQAAAAHPGLAGEAVEIVVVLDSCTDATAAEAARFPVTALSTEARNVGIGRGLGADFLLEREARWLAFTDADTIVAGDWLVAQLALGADVVCGSIGIADWGIHGDDAPYLRLDFDTTYRDVDGHAHVHGANLGVSAAAYRRAGGFPPLACQEDVALVERLRQERMNIVFSAAPRVWTSARMDSRARGGFGDAIRIALARRDCQGTLATPAARPR